MSRVQIAKRGTAAKFSVLGSESPSGTPPEAPCQQRPHSLATDMTGASSTRMVKKRNNAEHASNCMNSHTQLSPGIKCSTSRVQDMNHFCDASILQRTSLKQTVRVMRHTRSREKSISDNRGRHSGCFLKNQKAKQIVHSVHSTPFSSLWPLQVHLATAFVTRFTLCICLVLAKQPKTCCWRTGWCIKLYRHKALQ